MINLKWFMLILVPLLFFIGLGQYYRQEKNALLDKQKYYIALTTRQQQDIHAMQQARQSAAELDKKNMEELIDATGENDSLRRLLADGRRVRVAGKCTQLPHASSGASSMGDAPGIELSAIAGQNILAIRAGIISDRQKVKYLQQYIRQFCAN
ncbi:lysis system i-spanin subunit Rz [Izhakiella australiensis]|uniref:lysis system i-spanin subunit Rz n=1 Tax=Izhakiella australiensis TaxID=1926881 RepID=UPI000BBDD418|nr:lysis system i-spanin subunit Rz [Izhakiella australiensis]